MLPYCVWRTCRQEEAIALDDEAEAAAMEGADEVGSRGRSLRGQVIAFGRPDTPAGGYA